jgi:hypothetical protein
MLIMSTASFVVICIPSGMMTALTLKGQGVEWDQRFLQARLAANGGPTFSVTVAPREHCELASVPFRGPQANQGLEHDHQETG